MELVIKINNYLGNFDNIIGTLGLLIAIIGAIVGVIGKKQLSEAKKIVNNFKDSNVNNSQVAGTINNNGIGYKDTADIAASVTEERLKDFHMTWNDSDNPQNIKKGDYQI
jgi:hypothetical protein